LTLSGLTPYDETFFKLPFIPMNLESIGEVKFRKISSLESSELFASLEEKQESRKAEPLPIPIPSYPTSAPYRTSRAKRLFARLRYFHAVLKQRLSGKDYPIIAVVVVNNKCNWNCTYCFGDYPNRKEIDYTTDELKYLFDELYSMGVRYLNLHGGETLLRPDLGDLCHYVKQKGMYLCVITNGSLLHKKLEDIRNVDNLTISLDGAMEGNDLNRGKGTFETTLRAIEIATQEKIPLRVQATLTRSTMNDIGYLAKLALEMNFNLQFSILFKPLKKARDSQMSPSEIRTALSEIKKYKDLGYPIFTTDRALRASYEWPYDYNVRHHIQETEIPDSYRPHHIPCYYSRTKFTIEADGYIYPCFLTTDGSFQPKNWKYVGVYPAISHVQKTNLCRACPAMTQNDHNLLLGLDFPQIRYLVRNQLKETFRIRNRPKIK
jgi:MoaA/NifB/PqqE/SkfB family radical SAM enzyme